MNNIKLAVNVDKLRQEIRQEIEQELSQKIENAKKEEERIIKRAKNYTDSLIELEKEQIDEYKTIIKQAKAVIEIVKKHNIRNLANLAKSTEAGRIIKEMKRANKQLIYIDDIIQELKRMQPTVEKYQKIIAKLENYDKYKKQEQDINIVKDDYNDFN